jgi:hypothetical protein
MSDLGIILLVNHEKFNFDFFLSQSLGIFLIVLDEFRGGKFIF